MSNKLIDGVTGIAKAILGLDKADEATVKKRWTICQGGVLEDGTTVEKCGYYSNWKCGKCGCLLPAKLRVASQQCPLKTPKWGPVAQVE